MKRKIYSQLQDWKRNRSRQEALLIDGARRVGKSYIVKEFAQNEYRSYMLFDFTNLSSDVLYLFDHYLTDLDTLFSRLTLLLDIPCTNTKPYLSLMRYRHILRFVKPLNILLLMAGTTILKPVV